MPVHPQDKTSRIDAERQLDLLTTTWVTRGVKAQAWLEFCERTGWVVRSNYRPTVACPEPR